MPRLDAAVDQADKGGDGEAGLDALRQDIDELRLEIVEVNVENRGERRDKTDDTR